MNPGSTVLRRSLPLALGLALMAGPALADREAEYEVRVTNITKGQIFTPLLLATHSSKVRIFEVGMPASAALEVLAEAGGTGDLEDALISEGVPESNLHIIPVPGPTPLLHPGETAVITIRAKKHDRLSVAAMLIPTNDTFLAINGARLPFFGSRHLDAPAYDAGTEENDQSCEHMPGPDCAGQGAGEGHSPDPAVGDEGFVFIGNGFHDLGTAEPNDPAILGPFMYDWRNPVARVSIKRLH